MKRLFLPFAMIVLVFFSYLPAHATDADVTNCALSGAGSITAAVTAANSGGGIIRYMQSCTTNFSNSAGLQISAAVVRLATSTAR